MSKSPTIADIARAAHVSPSTVSRVLTGSTPVAPEKRAAVLEAIERLNFRPNMAARSLARGKSMAIGVLTQSMASLFYGELAQGIEEELQGSSYHPVFVSGQWHADEEAKALDLLRERQVDALILLAGELSDEQLHDLARQIPIIIVGRSVSSLETQCIRVLNYEGAYRATQYLIELGHRRIAHIQGTATHLDATERCHGYRQALLDAGLGFDERLVVEGTYTEQGGLMAAEVLLRRGVPFTALFAANDQTAYGARLAFYRWGLRVPDDVSLVGFDDLLTSAYTTPPLTTMRQHTIEMGRRAARGILQMLSHEQPNSPSFAPELIIRESTARLRE